MLVQVKSGTSIIKLEYHEVKLIGDVLHCITVKNAEDDTLFNTYKLSKVYKLRGGDEVVWL